MKEVAAGILYLCATPIGNLGDFSIRAAETLKNVGLIAAEDTRRTGQLLHHFGIETRMLSYHEHNKDSREKYLLELLLSGESVALVSDAGFPAIADPGEQLAQAAIAAGITVVPVPGANAALCALVASGLVTVPFFFGGFLPKTAAKRRRQLEEWAAMKATIILYEAPHRLRTVLEAINKCWGNRRLVLARELTKLHEEFFRGDLEAAMEHIADSPPRGEYVLVVEGAPDLPTELPAGNPLDEVRRLINEGIPTKEALRKVAIEYKLPKRDLYKKLILYKEGEN